MDALNGLLALPKKKRWDLEDVKRLLEATGNPQKRFKSIIVTGTNQFMHARARVIFKGVVHGRS